MPISLPEMGSRVQVCGIVKDWAALWAQRQYACQVHVDRSRCQNTRFTVTDLQIDSLHVSATSRLALRSRNVNVSVTTGMEA